MKDQDGTPAVTDAQATQPVADPGTPDETLDQYLERKGQQETTPQQQSAESKADTPEQGKQDDAAGDDNEPSKAQPEPETPDTEYSDDDLVSEVLPKSVQEKLSRVPKEHQEALSEVTKFYRKGLSKRFQKHDSEMRGRRNELETVYQETVRLNKQFRDKLGISDEPTVTETTKDGKQSTRKLTPEEVFVRQQMANTDMEHTYAAIVTAAGKIGISEEQLSKVPQETATEIVVLMKRHGLTAERAIKAVGLTPAKKAEADDDASVEKKAGVPPRPRTKHSGPKSTKEKLEDLGFPD